MTTIIICIVAFLLLSGLAFMLIYTLPISMRVYRDTLVRTSPEKWGHVCSATWHPEQSAMWEQGLAWAEQYKDHIREQWIENEGLKLYGQYFDFGSDRCAVILPGRCECLKYSYYFAEPYRKAGMNVLVIDARCHGLSEGTHPTIGVKESEDLRCWIRLLTDKLHNREIWLHGICVGTATAMCLLEQADCPKAVKGLVTEGCYVSFRETFKRHMIADKRPLFPVLDLIMLQIYRHTGSNVYRRKPIRAVKKIHRKALFLFGKEDVFSIPVKSQKLFDACASKEKKLVWFEHGSHSHLRLNNVETYDNAIVEFVNE